MSLRNLPLDTQELEVIRGPFITGWKPQLSKIYVAILESQDGEEYHRGTKAGFFSKWPFSFLF